MDFKFMAQTLNELLSKECPEKFNSAWILRRAPHCYRYIWKNVRTDFGTIDWDQVTRSLEWKFQRRWTPGVCRCSAVPYRNKRELNHVLEKYRSSLYVFVSPQDRADRNLRDTISVALVRLAQRGNESARQELLKLISYTIHDWIDHNCYLSCWRGFEVEIQTQVDRCIRKYRYSGSFLRYLFRTLEYAGRGIRPFQAFSLDEPVLDGSMRRIDRIPGFMVNYPKDSIDFSIRIPRSNQNLA
jgi:hypothetical protein